MLKLKKPFLLLIRGYQVVFSLDRGLFSRPGFSICRFYPSCSEYAYLAVEKYGFFSGLVKGLKRIAHCHPWNEGGYDPLA